MPHLREKQNSQFALTKKTDAIYFVNCIKYFIGPAQSWGFSVVSARRLKIASVAGISGYKNKLRPVFVSKMFSKNEHKITVKFMINRLRAIWPKGY